MKKTCYITTPIYYASGNVHIGNSYSTIACDAFARYKRLKGYDTIYLTGMDEHGQKIEEAAQTAGISPQEHVDRIAKNTKELWNELEISNDGFIRTTDEYHVNCVKKAFEKLIEQGDIYLGSYEGNYCVSCEAFFTKTQLQEGDTCPDCGKKTRLVKEECYFLKLKKYEKQLLDYIESHPDFIMPETRRNEVISFIKSGLEDLCVSRTSYKWGIPVTSNPEHVIYVWIDALTNYISYLGYNSLNEDNFNKYWVNGDEVYHVVGKDILRFHAVYWPIMLMALGLPIKFKLYVHGWVLMKGGKMSKSKGNVVYPSDIKNRYGLDALRFYLTKELPLGNDGLFTYDRFIEEYNVYLANDLGNLVSRTISMVNKYFSGSVEKNTKEFAHDKEAEDVLSSSIASFDKYFNDFQLQNGIHAIFETIDFANKYIDLTAPWVLAKDEEKKEELASVLYHLLEMIRNSAIMLSCVMPSTSKKIMEYLNKDDIAYDKLGFGLEKDYKVCEKAEPLFARLDLAFELEDLGIENE